ncbi:MAG: hypothetical protein ACK4Z9_02720, partial [Thermodesulfovibrionales bacterium]
SSFISERESILHRGIYNRELASALAASVLSGGLFVFLSARTGNKILLYIMSILVFSMAFIFFRTVILKESYLEAVFDKYSGQVSIVIKRPFRMLQSNFPIGSLSDIVLSHREFEPGNPDGIEVVEKVALQHGTVIPGFGEKRVFYSLELSFEPDRKTTIFVTGERDEALTVADKIKGFLGERDVNSIR